jgi:hypothetical protein
MRHRARRHVLALAATAALASFALIAPAYTASAHPTSAATTFAHPGIPFRPGGPISHLIGPRATGGLRNQVSSQNWSGYAVSGGTYTSVSSSWTEPTGLCSSGGDTYSSFWIGLDGYSSTTVEQTGSEVDCSGGTPQYYSWYEFYPANSVVFSNPVKPGDHFTGSVTSTGNSGFTLKLADATEGWSHTVTGTVAGATSSSAEVVIEAPCCTSSGGILPLADFGTASFTSSLVDGTAIGSLSPTDITMVSANGVQEDSISALTSGENFTGTWDSSG